jgi:dCTP deaminase
MSLLSDAEIREAVGKKDIQITPFNDALLEPASYDFRVGRALVGGIGIVDIKTTPHILKPGDWVELETIEEISLSTNIAGTLGIRSSITRKGIDGYCGPQIDPGYNGKLYFNLFNPSSESFKISYGDKMCTITFFRLEKPASKPYTGHYQNLKSFPEEDIQRMMSIDSPTIADVITSVGILERTVNNLNIHIQKLNQQFNNVSRDVSWIKTLLFAILIAIIIGLAIVVFQRIL